MSSHAQLIYTLSTGECRQLRREQIGRILRIYPFPDSPINVEMNLATLRISWPKVTDQTIDAAERFANAFLCVLEESHALLDERGKHSRRLPGV